MCVDSPRYHTAQNDSYTLAERTQTATSKQYLNGDWTAGDTTYYRYYTDDVATPGTGYSHSKNDLKQVLLPDAYSKAVASLGNLDNIANIANYTCYSFDYNGDHRVATETVYGGSRTYTLAGRTQKFWSGRGAEALLQLAADYLSETKPLTTFWRDRPNGATGQRCYQAAS